MKKLFYICLIFTMLFSSSWGQSYSTYQFNQLSVFDNVDISMNSAPQNEPSVRISRKDPNRVLAAWRDFRRGINPTRWRIGYSLSTDGGSTWSTNKLIPWFNPVYAYSSDPSVVTDTAGNFFIFTVTFDKIFSNFEIRAFKSNDAGATIDTSFLVSDGGLDDKELATCDLNPNSPYVNNLYVSWINQSTVLFSRSPDDGVRWTKPLTLNSKDSVEAPVPVVGPNGEVYVIWNAKIDSSYGIFFTKSTDGGKSFKPDTMLIQALCNSILEFRFPSLAVDVSDGINSGNIYVTWSDTTNGDEDVFLIRSTDGGTTWSDRIRVNNDSIGNGKQQFYPQVTVNEKGDIYILFGDTRNTSSSDFSDLFFKAYLAESTDGGLTFTNTELSSQESPTNIPPPPSGVGFGDYIGIDSYNGRVVPVWHDERAGGYDMEIYTAVINNLTSVESKTTQPVSFLLYQNYPNPFNPTTNIKYSIPKASLVSLKVYDILGRKVVTLVNEEKPIGNYEIEFNAANLSSGVYFYTIKAGAFVQTKKMLLIK